MAGSATILSVEIGEASTANLGDINGTSPAPDVSGVTFYPFYIDRAVLDAMGGGAEFVSIADYGSNRPGESTPRSVDFMNRTGSTSYGASDGERFATLQVESVDMSARLVTLPADPSVIPEGIMLRSVFAYRSPTNPSITANADGGDNSTIPCDTTSNFDAVVGDVVRVNYANSDECTRHIIVQVNAGAGGNVKVHPDMRSAISDTDVVDVEDQFYAVTGTANVAGSDFHIRGAAGGNSTDADFGRIVPGCRLGALSMTADDQGALIMAYTASSKVAVDNDSPASVVASTERTGAVVNAFRDSTLQIGPNIVGQSAPYTAAATYDRAKLFDGGSINMEWDISDGPTDGRTVMGVSDREITNARMTMDVTVTNADEGQVFKRMLANEEQRWIIRNFGPGGEPVTDDPTGMGVIALMSRSPDESAVANGEERLRRSVTLRAVNDGTNIVDGSTTLATSPFRITWPTA